VRESIRVPVTLFPWQIIWLDTAGFVEQADTAMTDDQTTYLFTLPASATSFVNGENINNVGTWRVNLVRSNRARQQTASFTVHDPAQSSADVFVQKFARDGDGSAPAGSNIAHLVVVGNQGPDTAQSVHVVDSAPSGATLLTFTQQSGPTCAPAGNSDCTMTSLINGDRAEFTAIYQMGTFPGQLRHECYRLDYHLGPGFDQQYFDFSSYRDRCQRWRDLRYDLSYRHYDQRKHN
jgi:uncharacterized repeat protein (TIGR01451 family)